MEQEPAFRGKQSGEGSQRKWEARSAIDGDSAGGRFDLIQIFGTETLGSLT